MSTETEDYCVVQYTYVLGEEFIEQLSHYLPLKEAQKFLSSKRKSSENNPFIIKRFRGDLT